MSKKTEAILEKAKLELTSPPATIFDTFDTSIDSRLVGNAVKERLGELTQISSRIRQLATNAMLMYKQALNRKEDIIALAWEAVNKSEKVTRQRVLVKSIIVEINNEKTTINDEEQRINLYEYVYQRGKDKIAEVDGALDAARSMLSWAKTEVSKSTYD